ncbi:MAG TPA: TrbC/VirB2 family protein [Solirubrobacteraceae bacterium]|nr:TrbC/VirB2 family protein [Solirubrobacteraceae bacterium]
MRPWFPFIGSSLPLAIGSVLALGAPAGAATSGPAMPWDTPLQTILNSMSGTVAHILITAAVITTGLVFAFTEHGAGARRLFGVAFGGALALAALSFMTAVGWAGATF